MAENTKITLKINGIKCQVPSGTTILDAAQSIGINIPIICLHDATTAEGLCRQCVVEVDGWSRLAPSSPAVRLPA